MPWGIIDGVEVVAGTDHTIRATGGFQWRNNFQPRYADAAIGCASGAGLTVDTHAGRYGAADCGTSHDVTRTDGQRFDLLSVDVAALDMTSSTGSDPAPNPSFGYTADYLDWTYDSSFRPEDRFWIAGLRDGAETDRVYFGTRADPLDTSALTDLTGFRLGWDTSGTPFTDNITLIGYESDRQYCYAACEFIELTGFDFALRDAAPQIAAFAAARTTLMPVPIPGALPLMLGALSLGYWIAGRRSA